MNLSRELSGTVRIHQDAGNMVGGGFLFTSTQILTCAHVIEKALRLPISFEKPNGIIKIDFPLAIPIIETEAKIIYWNRSQDIAVLILDSPFPETANIQPARLVQSTELVTHPFHALGFPAKNPNGAWSEGHILDRDGNGLYQTVNDKTTGHAIELGFSGTAIWDDNLSGVVGMVKATDPSLNTRTAYFLPIKRILETLQSDPNYIPFQSSQIDLNLPGRIVKWEKGLPNNLELPNPSANPVMTDHIYISDSINNRELIKNISLDLFRIGHHIKENGNPLFAMEKWKQNIVDDIFYSSIVLFFISSESIISEKFYFEAQIARQFNKTFVVIITEFTPNKIDLESLFGLHEFPFVNFGKDYQENLNNLLKSELLPVPAKVSEYCRVVSSVLEQMVDTDYLHLDRYIPEEARILNNNANPDRPGSLKGEREDVIKQLANIKKAALVLGEPGAGKTVVLERFAWELANKEKKTDLPILIHLAEIRESTIERRILTKIITTHELDIDTEENALLFLKNNRGYFLLDGLNEVETRWRSTLISEILKLDERFTRFRIVVTSRIRDASWRELQKTKHFETLVIQDITDENAKNYLRAYLQTAEAERLWRNLDTNLIELIRTPLLLKLLKEFWLTHQDHRNIRMPKNRGELYEEFIDARFVNDNIEGQKRYEMMNALEKLASEMQVRDNWKEIDRGEALEIIKKDGLINDLLISGFLIDTRGYLRFPHHTFQEFYAARSIRSNFGKFIEYTYDVKWFETFIQLAGITNTPDTLITAIADKNVWLAFWCIAEGKLVNTNIKNDVEARSIRLVDSKKLEDRMGAAYYLSELQIERAIPYLIRLLHDPFDEVSDIALGGLARLGIAAAANLLSEFNHQGSNLDRRIKLAHAMGLTQDLRYGVMPVENQPLKIDWVLIQTDETVEGYGAQGPQTQFYMSRYLITNSQYEAFITARDGASSQWWICGDQGFNVTPDLIPISMKYSDFSLPNLPAVYVSWYDALAFCDWLGSLLGYEIRLPTESEWEFAAQAAGKLDYLTNKHPNPNGVNSYETGIVKLTPVGVFPDEISHLNLKDIVGNVFSWCLTKWRENPEDLEDNDLTGDHPRVLRGGSFIHTLDINRMGEFPYVSNYYTGFRIVRSVNKEDK